MRTDQMVTTIIRACRRALHLLARPMRGNQAEGQLAIQPYRGYGSHDEIFLMGLVVRQPAARGHTQAGTLGRDLLDIGRRILRRGVANAVLVTRFSGTEQRVTTDRDGYFFVHLHPRQPPPTDQLWHQIELELVHPDNSLDTVIGHVFVPPESARYVVISDIDDTVIYTGVANKLKMLWRLFVQGAQSRVAFPGVAALYRALYHGVSGADQNPLLYVSRGPWSIYEVLDEFFQHHDIPVGPVLFLREWGVSLRHPFPRRAKDHKHVLIREMLQRYPHLPFVLIGDSGQHDPEIYAQMVREHPGRVLAIYIRNITRDPARRHAIEALAQEVVAAGSSLVLAADSFAMAEHAAEHGLIDPGALAEVLNERVEQQGDLDLQATHEVKRATKQATRTAVAHGALDTALEAEPQDDTPPNVVIEPKDSDAS